MVDNDRGVTDFGYERISIADKSTRVGEVFRSVADRYDLMNDLMSFGIHRLWKRFAVGMMGLRSGQRILDVAGGTGDLTLLLARGVKAQGRVVLVDINEAMLQVGRQKCLDRGIVDPIEYVQADAESLPFGNDYFDGVCIGFGLRNVTDKPAALGEMYRVIKPGGRVLILEFAKPTMQWLEKLYDAYSFGVLPWLGKIICNDSASYRYLVESIRLHPDQGTLQKLMESVGFSHCDYHNLTGGIVSLHKGFKF